MTLPTRNRKLEEMQTIRSGWRKHVGIMPIMAVALVAVGGAAVFFMMPDSAPAPKPPAPIAAPPAPLAADPSDPQSQFVLALSYRNGDAVDDDGKKALRLATLAAAQGYAPAQTLAGMMYQNGEGVAADPDTAASYYLKAAEQDDPWAQSLLGGMYLGGTGVEQSNVHAYKWLTRAAGHGSAAAKSLLEIAQNTFTDEERQEGEAEAAQE